MGELGYAGTIDRWSFDDYKQRLVNRIREMEAHQVLLQAFDEVEKRFDKEKEDIFDHSVYREIFKIGQHDQTGAEILKETVATFEDPSTTKGGRVLLTPKLLADYRAGSERLATRKGERMEFFPERQPEDTAADAQRKLRVAKQRFHKHK